MVLLDYSTAARRGELLALRWSNIDSNNNTVTISASLSQTKDGVSLKGTKIDRTRTVPLSRLALEALTRQRAMQAADKLRVGQLYCDAGFVFADELGACVSPMAATNAYARISRKARISSTRLHVLRHTAATTMLLAGVDVATTAGVLGHSTPTTTLGIYATRSRRSEEDRHGSARRGA